MAIVQKNLYMPGQNLTNLALNVDLNRLGIDKSNISIDFGTVPATVTIKTGSIIEVNGNVYVIEGSDYSFQMANAAHNYITFTDNPTAMFGSAAAIGTYRDDKIGYYQADNVTRTIDWFIDQSAQNEYLYQLRPMIIRPVDIDVLKVNMSIDGGASALGTLIEFDTVLFDRCGNYNTVTHQFIAKYTGYYLISCKAYIDPAGFTSIQVVAGAEESWFQSTNAWNIVSEIFYLISGETVEVYAYRLLGGGTVQSDRTQLSINRVI